ncbi:hypothetical protein A2U01_0051429 [Trifolium medium]|uniref:Reverse transcriptase domain-containing protein n=1 Tax=Trifolium medium TaxID=97028 RepID=A0A392R302_9FABA|nr:hypothetical protein [Trifolium medium]
MDNVFSDQIGKNLEVYIDDMVVKTANEDKHDQDLADILASVKKYNMRLNPAKCSFGVQAGKFMGFMLTNRWIEANPEKCQAIIDMRNLTSVKEVQQITGRNTRRRWQDKESLPFRKSKWNQPLIHYLVQSIRLAQTLCI